ncbi:hypothetical protein B0H10DRAFT_1969398 [Mycena sp. CBHHK59/15]|nr:hypothetical protein B0H10DRAFT_1969398 [Mycena sp. CBHHK59/15]
MALGGLEDVDAADLDTNSNDSQWECSQPTQCHIKSWPDMFIYFLLYIQHKTQPEDGQTGMDLSSWIKHIWEKLGPLWSQAIPQAIRREHSPKSRLPSSSGEDGDEAGGSAEKLYGRDIVPTQTPNS